ncbi:MAG: hypothetical protein K9M82_05290 [Deltaproteobacteria bacterium]|nr:hypothetical protein [Deltaproteobacteria bacterium]
MEMNTTVTVHSSLPIGNRLTEAGRQLRAWLESLGTPYEQSVHRLRSNGFEKRGQEYHYHYLLRKETDREGGANL